MEIKRKKRTNTLTETRSAQDKKTESAPKRLCCQECTGRYIECEQVTFLDSRLHKKQQWCLL